MTHVLHVEARICAGICVFPFSSHQNPNLLCWVPQGKTGCTLTVHTRLCTVISRRMPFRRFGAQQRFRGGNMTWYTWWDCMLQGGDLSCISTAYVHCNWSWTPLVWTLPCRTCAAVADLSTRDPPSSWMPVLAYLTAHISGTESDILLHVHSLSRKTLEPPNEEDDGISVICRCVWIKMECQDLPSIVCHEMDPNIYLLEYLLIHSW